jgi:transcriptional regulator with XRE-family HTH domain
VTTGEEYQEHQWHRFGENVRAHRERKGMSQADVARLMTERGWGWYQSTVYKTEQGRRRADAFEARDLALVFSVPLDRLFWPAPEESAVALAEDAVQRLVNAWHKAAESTEHLIRRERTAASAVATARESKYPRAREAATELAEVLAEYTLQLAIAQAIDRTDDHAGEPGEAKDA